jgi:hypothetical protein
VLKDDDFALGLERTLLFATARVRIFMAHRVITCTDATHRRVPIDEVRYFTASHHGSICHFGSPLQEGPLRLTLEEVSSKFDERRFVRCHKSYVVNLSYVVSCTSNRLVLDDGSVLPVGACIASRYAAHWQRAAVTSAALLARLPDESPYRWLSSAMVCGWRTSALLCHYFQKRRNYG